MKKIEGVWYNDTEISKMSFEDFCATIPTKTKDFQKNIYFQITGKKYFSENLAIVTGKPEHLS